MTPAPFFLGPAKAAIRNLTLGWSGAVCPMKGFTGAEERATEPGPEARLAYH